MGKQETTKESYIYVDESEIWLNGLEEENYDK